MKEDFDKNTREVLRKMTLVADLYRKSPATQHLAPTVKRSVERTLGISVVNGDGKFFHSLEKSRKGLVLLERVLSFLNLPIDGDKLSSVLLENGGQVGREWADFAKDEWSTKSASGQGWVSTPVILCFVKTPPSTFRCLVQGFEAMGLVERRKSRKRPSHATATMAQTITAEGQEFLKELEK